jgi:hypothetical protein
MKFRVANPKNVNRKYSMMRFGRFLLWVVIILVLVRGIVTFIPKEETTAEAVVDIPYITSSSAQGFAESFVKDYYTYDPSDKNDSYEERMRFYFPSNFTGDPLRLASFDSPIKVVRAEAISYKKLDDTHAVYTVRAVLNYQSTIEDDGENKTVENSTVRFIDVPLSVQNNNLYVYDYPTFVVKKGLEKAELASLPDLIRADDETLEEINSVLEDFFKSYSTATSSQISFLLDSNNSSILGYEGSILFNDLKEVHLFDITSDGKEHTGETTKVLAYVESTWEDFETGVTYNQKHRFIYTYDGERWLVNEFLGGWPKWN